ncbi:MAG TPA: metalloregulator ArsR/SmtB family transcription factor [Anaerolineales bacterium]|nr:metalloregulator ArsR/SmtB family transcription factor [Anaerolineales bacterium]
MDPLTEKVFKTQLYEHFAGICKAFGHPVRFQFLELLTQGEFSVEELAREVGVSVANASQHLQTLRAAQLVQVRREGSYAIYSLTDDAVFEVVRSVRAVAERNIAEIDRLKSLFLSHRGHMQPVQLDELPKRLAAGETLLVDVRPANEFAAGHIPGAVSYPLDELADNLENLTARQTLIVYCRGPYSLLADRAVALLQAHGLPAQRLESGFPDWRSRSRAYADCFH